MSRRSGQARRHAIAYLPEDRRERRAARRAVREHLAELGPIEQARAQAVEMLPFVTGRRRHGPMPLLPASGGFWSKLPLRQPAHWFTSRQAAGVWPYLTGPRRAPLGPVLGLNLENRDVFAFDPWSFYNAGRVGSTGILIMGAYRQGKSWFLKRLIVLLIACGRQAINTSDSKGEHAAVARAIGGTVIRLGDPSQRVCINPLDGGHRPSSRTEAEWQIEVRTRRSLVLTQIIELIRGKTLETDQQTVLDEALDGVVEASQDRPTIRAVHERLLAISTGKVEIEGMARPEEAAERLWHTLRVLVRGNLSGMFEDESTITLDAESPYTVFDTSQMAARGDTALAISQAVTHAWVQSVLADKEASRHFLLAREEGWRDMRSRAALEAQILQQKLAGDLGISQLLVVHEGGDFDAVGDEGSKERELAMQIAKGFATKISFAQGLGQLQASARAVGLTPDQADRISELQVGQCVVAIGQDTVVLDTRATSTAWEAQYFNTDASMRSRDERVEEDEAVGGDHVKAGPEDDAELLLVGIDGSAADAPAGRVPLPAAWSRASEHAGAAPVRWALSDDPTFDQASIDTGPIPVPHSAVAYDHDNRTMTTTNDGGSGELEG